MKKVLKNFFYQGSYQLLVMMLPIVTIPIVSRALGATGIGQYKFVVSISSYFILIAGLGLSKYAIREIALVRENRAKLSKRFWELQAFNVIFSSLALMLYFSMIATFNNRTFYLIQGIAIFASLFDITWFFSGLEDFKKITIRNFVVKLTTFILIVVLIREQDDLALYFILQTTGALIGQLTLWLSIHKKIDFVKVTFKEIFAHFLPILSFFVARVAINLYTNVNKTVLGLLTNMEAVGLYASALALNSIASLLINTMNVVLIPHMSHLFGKNNDEQMIHVLQKTIHIQLYFTIAATFGLITISSKLVPWFFGDGFERLTQIIPLTAPILIVQSLQMSIAAQYLIPRKEMKDYNISVVAGAIVSIVVNLLLTPFIGVYGAIIALFIGFLVICFLRIKVLIAKTSFRFNYFEILRYVISGLVMWGSIQLLTASSEANWVTTLLQIVAGIAIYLLASTVMKANPLWVLMVRILKKKRV